MLKALLRVKTISDIKTINKICLKQGSELFHLHIL